MRLPKDNLVAIAYKTGYCGSLVYALLAMSPEVAQFVAFDEPTFNDGTAHSVQEQWFRNLHDYRDSLTVCEQNWNSYVPETTWQALQKDQLILFRCHPNTAVKLNFIENLRVIYVTHRNKYIPERWAYEKVYKPQGDKLYQQDLDRLFDTKKSIPVSNQIKRNLLIKNVNHHVVEWKQVKKQMKTASYLLPVDQLLDKDYSIYTDLCKYLTLSPMTQDKFDYLINQYNSKQWKRF
jgi:hypothetical protein